jgi:hypothetical protein
MNGEAESDQQHRAQIRSPAIGPQSVHRDDECGSDTEAFEQNDREEPGRSPREEQRFHDQAVQHDREAAQNQCDVREALRRQPASRLAGSEIEQAEGEQHRVADEAQVGETRKRHENADDEDVPAPDELPDEPHRRCCGKQGPCDASASCEAIAGAPRSRCGEQRCDRPGRIRQHAGARAVEETREDQ